MGQNDIYIKVTGQSGNMKKMVLCQLKWYMWSAYT